MRDRIKYVVMSAVMSAMMICTLPVYGTTVRDNYVHFTNAKLKYFAWDESEHRITDGQPWGGVTWGKTNTTTGYIHVRAGRSRSTEVATWFKTRAKPHAVGTRVVSDVWPEELNFAIYGHMRLHLTNNRKTVCHNVVIGQGHVGAYNNWWIGGKHMHHEGDQYWLECNPTDAELAKGYCAAVVPIYTSGSYTFPLDIWMCPPAASVSLSSDELWPANGKMHEIEATIIVDDCDDPGSIEVLLTSVESNEDPGIEDDIKDADIGVDDRFFRLRAERSSDGDGRVYTVTYDITDGCGEETTVEATVTVPHDKGKIPPGYNFRKKQQ